MMAYATVGQLFTETEDFERKLKIALLWFDKILVQSFGESFLVDYLIENNDLLKGEHENSLRETIIDIPYEINIYEPPNNIELHNNAKKVISDYFGAEYNGKERDVALESNYTSQCIENWIQLNHDEPYGFIGREIERRIIEKTLHGEQVRSQSNITESLDITFPSLENMSWSTIFELRNHQFIEAFREKINSLKTSLENNDHYIFRELVNEMIRKDLKSIFSLVKPTPNYSIAFKQYTQILESISTYSISCETNEITSMGHKLSIKNSFELNKAKFLDVVNKFLEPSSRIHDFSKLTPTVFYKKNFNKYLTKILPPLRW